MNISLPTLVLIVEAVSLLEYGQTDTETNSQTQLNPLPTPTAINILFVWPMFWDYVVKMIL